MIHVDVPVNDLCVERQISVSRVRGSSVQSPHGVEHSGSSLGVLRGRMDRRLASIGGVEDLEYDYGGDGPTESDWSARGKTQEMASTEDEALSAVTHISNIVRAAAERCPDLLTSGNDEALMGLLGARQQLIGWLQTQSRAENSSHAQNGVSLSSTPSILNDRDWSASTTEEYRDNTASWGAGSGFDSARLDSFSDSSEDGTPRQPRSTAPFSFNHSASAPPRRPINPITPSWDSYGSFDTNSLMPVTKRPRLASPTDSPDLCPGDEMNAEVSSSIPSANHSNKHGQRGNQATESILPSLGDSPRFPPPITKSKPMGIPPIKLPRHPLLDQPSHRLDNDPVHKSAHNSFSPHRDAHPSHHTLPFAGYDSLGDKDPYFQTGYATVPQWVQQGRSIPNPSENSLHHFPLSDPHSAVSTSPYNALPSNPYGLGADSSSNGYWHPQQSPHLQNYHSELPGPLPSPHLQNPLPQLTPLFGIQGSQYGQPLSQRTAQHSNPHFHSSTANLPSSYVPHSSQMHHYNHPPHHHQQPSLIQRTVLPIHQTPMSSSPLPTPTAASLVSSNSSLNSPHWQMSPYGQKEQQQQQLHPQSQMCYPIQQHRGNVAYQHHHLQQQEQNQQYQQQNHHQQRMGGRQQQQQQQQTAAASDLVSKAKSTSSRMPSNNNSNVGAARSNVSNGTETYDPPLITKTVSKTGRPLPPVSMFKVKPSKSTPLPQVDPSAAPPSFGSSKLPVSLASVVAPGLMDSFDWRKPTPSSRKRNANRVANSAPEGSSKLTDFSILGVLGTGTFGKVHLCQHIPSKQYYCMKVLKKQTIYRFKQMDHIINEKHLLLQLRYPGIVQLYATFNTKDSLMLLMEYVPGGELFYYIRKFGRLSEDVARFYAAELVLTILHLHERQIVYRDLKPENILLDSTGHLKLADFGFAKQVVDKTWTMCGTPDYLAPEIITGHGHDTAVDWWSLGVLIFEMLAGYPPFTDKDMGTLFRKIQEPERLFLPPDFSQEASDLIRRLLVVDPSRRLGNIHLDISDIQTHPWFRSIHWEQAQQRLLPGPIVPILPNPAEIAHQDQQQDPNSDPSSIPHPPLLIPEDVQRLFDRF